MSGEQPTNDFFFREFFRETLYDIFVYTHNSFLLMSEAEKKKILSSPNKCVSCFVLSLFYSSFFLPTFFYDISSLSLAATLNPLLQHFARLTNNFQQFFSSLFFFPFPKPPSCAAVWWKRRDKTTEKTVHGWEIDSTVHKWWSRARECARNWPSERVLGSEVCWYTQHKKWECFGLQESHEIDVAALIIIAPALTALVHVISLKTATREKKTLNNVVLI